jgi:6-phosphogluconolactonase
VRASATRRLEAIGLLLLVGCGGGGNSGIVTPPSVTPPSENGPTSGIYLFEGNAGSSLNLSTINSSTGALGSSTLAGSPADDSSDYPGVAITPSNKFLFALYTSLTVIEGFQVAGPGLQLTLLPGAPFFPSASSGPFNSLVLHPTGKFLYVIESPATIEEFSVDAQSGNLTHASAVTETADLRVAVIDPAGKFLFATDLTGGRIFAYQINPSSGALSAVAGSPFTVPASGQPILDVIESTGKFLYAPLSAGGVAAFVVNSSTGALTDVPGSPFATSNVPSSIAIAPSGKFIYVPNFQDGSIDGFGIDTNTGALSQVTGSPFRTAPSPSNVVVDPSGNFLYVSIYPASTIYGFSLDSSTGSLSALIGSPFPSVPNPTNLMILKIP